MNVVDANVLVSALRSRNGASHAVLRGMLTGDVSFAASPAVVLEYEAVLKRPGIFGPKDWLALDEIERLLDAICALAIPALPLFRFRPFLSDAKDDIYIEWALAAGAHTIITRDKGFRAAALSAFGLRSQTPSEFVLERRSSP